MKQLKDAYDRFETNYKAAVRLRDEARDQIWGFDGALRKYFTAMLGLAASKASDGLKYAIGLSKALMGMSGEGNVEDIIKATKAIASDPLKSAAKDAAVKTAVEQAQAYFDQTGDTAGALRMYEDSIAKAPATVGSNFTKGLSLVTGVIDYANQTKKLADLVQEWFTQNEEANRAQTEMDDVNRRMDELQQRITACREGSAAVSSHDIQLAAYFAVATTRTSDAAAIAGQLRATGQQLDAVGPQIEAAAPWLLPFLSDAKVTPRFAAALLSKAVPHLEAIQNAVDDAVSQGQGMENQLKQAIPQNHQSGGASANTAVR
jgi:hypothetical protein